MKVIPRQDILIEGASYAVGIGDKEFREVTYIGEGQMYNKPMLKFKTKEDRPLSINPSFHSWTLEEDYGKD